MKIILLKDIANIGRRYEVKEIKDGYAINYLIPNKLAIIATKEAIKSVEIEKAKNEGERKLQESLIVKNLDGLKDVTLVISAKTNNKGHLFAGLHKEDLVKEIESQTKLSIDSSFIKLDSPIKEIGDYTIEINAQLDKTVKSVKLKLRVQSSS